MRGSNPSLRSGRTDVRCAFVSTNSITQGEQVGVLWSWLLAQGIKIHFSHRTFRWSNEASGKAAVHCVIVGFGLRDAATNTIYEYDDVNGEPHALIAANINPYLVDAADVVLPARSAPIRPVSEMLFGSKPADGGNLIFSVDERRALLAHHPDAAHFLKRYTGAEDFLHDQIRYCLWLIGASPAELRRVPTIIERVESVREFRLKSTKAATRKQAATPTLFAEIRQSAGSYLLIPRVTSERRMYVPVGFISADTVANDQCFVMANCGLFEFGVVCSQTHNAWMRQTCGRLESRFRYSNTIVYNNFPWPDIGLHAASPSPQPSPARGRGGQTDSVVAVEDASVTKADAASAKLRAAIETAAQGVLDACAAHPESSLADLYDPVAMPPDLTKAHQKLDAAVDAT